jgi:hypothetical protein
MSLRGTASVLYATLLALGAPSSSLRADYIIIGRPTIAAQAAMAMHRLAEYGESLAAANAAFAQARSAYFSQYPDGSEIGNAGENLGGLLWEKDFYYLWSYLPTGVTDDPTSYAGTMRALGVLTLQPGSLDNGIPLDAEEEFSSWVQVVRRELGASYDDAPLPSWPTLATLLPALGAAQPEYDAYRKARDEAELEAWCKRTAARFCSSNAPATAPTHEDNGFYDEYFYGTVPDDFVPPIPPFDPDKKRVVIHLKKLTPGLLVAIVVGKFGHGDGGSHEQDIATNSPEMAIYDEDVGAVWKQDGIMLKCEYQSSGGAGIWEELYWWKVVPDAADPARLKARMARHPLLAYHGAADTCPPTRPNS